MPRQVASAVRGSVLRNRVIELGKDLLDRVEIGRVARQKDQLGARGRCRRIHLRRARLEERPI